MCKSKVDTEHPLQPGRSLTSIHEHGGTTSSIKDHKGILYVPENFQAHVNVLHSSVRKLHFFKGNKYLLPGKILSRKLDLFGSKILLTKDDPLPQPIAARTNLV